MSSGFQALCLNTNRSELSGSCFVLFTYLFDVLSLMCILKFPISCSTPCSKSACLMGLLFNRIAHAVAHASTLFLCRPETGAELLEMDSYLALILGGHQEKLNRQNHSYAKKHSSHGEVLFKLSTSTTTSHEVCKIASKATIPAKTV